MEKHAVAVFKPFPFSVGQKIYIDGGPRKGDWEVVGVGDRKVTLRCPISQREFEWNRFCYFAEKRQSLWPSKD